MKNLILQEIKMLKQKRLQVQTFTQKDQSEDDKHSEKSTITTKSYVSQSRVNRTGVDLFKGMKFCFPIADIDLSPKRIELISSSIKQQGGIVVAFSDKCVGQIIDFVLINPKAMLGAVLKKIENKMQFKEILDFHFVLHSLREGVLLALQKYCLYKSANAKQEQQTVTMTVAIKPKKAVKTEQSITQYIENKYQPNTEDEFQLQEQELQPLIPLNSVKSMSLVQSCKRILNSKSKHHYEVDKDKFLCQKIITQQSLDKFSINKFICQELMKLQKIYESEKDIGRKIAYLKAVSTIKSLDYQIESEKDIENVRGIGKQIKNKVKELITTGKLQKLQKLEQCERKVSETDFCKVWGIGPSKAQQIFKEGIRTVEQLKTRTDLLNKNQRLGLRYFQDFQLKIPREKVTRIFEFVKCIFKRCVDSIQNYNIQVCGSYRRGKQTCGDIDIIISRRDGYYQKKLLLNFILELEKQKLLTDHLQFPSASDSRSSISYMGVCQYEEEVHHRIDIKYYPIDQYAYALLYFTGSDMFNRSMRLYARKVGLSLSDHGAQARRDQKSGALWEKPIPFCQTEEEIFAFMGLDYRAPRQRQV